MSAERRTPWYRASPMGKLPWRILRRADMPATVGGLHGSPILADRPLTDHAPQPKHAARIPLASPALPKSARNKRCPRPEAALHASLSLVWLPAHMPTCAPRRRAAQQLRHRLVDRHCAQSWDAKAWACCTCCCFKRVRRRACLSTLAAATAVACSGVSVALHPPLPAAGQRAEARAKCSQTCTACAAAASARLASSLGGCGCS